MADARTALVTGARRGIGRAIALALAEAGFDIVVNDVQADDVGRGVVAAIEALGRRAILAPANIADLSAHEGLVQTAVDAFGHIDCLVNNAGVSVLERGGPLGMSVESYDRCMSINLRGPFFLTQQVAMHMLMTRAAGLHDRHDHLGQCRGGLGRPRRVLHLEGRPVDDEPGVCSRAWRRAISACSRSDPASSAPT